MITTKQKILKQALFQLNTNGMHNVSIRTISKALSISSGNLTYHYKNLDVIIYELYLDLVLGFNAMIEELNGKVIDKNIVMASLKASFELMWQYRFLFVDFVAIGRRIPKLKENFKSLMQMRQWQFEALSAQLIAAGVLIAEPYTNAYANLSKQLIVYSNAWVVDALMNFDEKDEQEIIAYYLNLQLSLLQPFLKKDA